MSEHTAGEAGISKLELIGVSLAIYTHAQKLGRILEPTFCDDLASAAIEAVAPRLCHPSGDVVVTKDANGHIVSVTRRDNEGSTLRVIAESTPRLASAQVPAVVQEVLDELNRAMEKFPTWPTDPLHALAIFNEEAGELSKAVLQQAYEPHKNEAGDVRKEAVQAAAMAIRFIASLYQYVWTRSPQHEQPMLLATQEPDERSCNQWVCHNCEHPLPEGCKGRFKDEVECVGYHNPPSAGSQPSQS